MFLHLHNYFDYHVCVSIRPVSGFRHKIFFSLQSPWNHPMSPGVDPRGWPWVAPGHAAPPEELARARRALSSKVKTSNWFFSKMPLRIFFVIGLIWKPDLYRKSDILVFRSIDFFALRYDCSWVWYVRLSVTNFFFCLYHLRITLDPQGQPPA